ncbi:MAG: hypothetical protein P8165_06180 [Deltaproteobacteria bacterium]
MTQKATRLIHASEFSCEAPRKFYEHCALTCPRSSQDCPDLAKGVAILSGKQKVNYNGSSGEEREMDATTFDCEAPLRYFEKTRKLCAHKGRCREEGLLLALLNGKRELDYSRKREAELPRIGEPRKKGGAEREVSTQALG